MPPAKPGTGTSVAERETASLMLGRQGQDPALHGGTVGTLWLCSVAGKNSQCLLPGAKVFIRIHGPGLELCFMLWGK